MCYKSGGQTLMLLDQLMQTSPKVICISLQVPIALFRSRNVELIRQMWIYSFVKKGKSRVVCEAQ